MNKKNTVKNLLLAALLVGGSINALAQTPAQKERMLKDMDVVRLKELAAKYDKEFKEKQAEAFRLAQINNWPTEIKENGTVAKLTEVTPEGSPVYTTTYNLGSTITSRVNHLHPGGSLGLNLKGQNMAVGVWDGDYPLSSHVDFTGRFFIQDGGSTPIAFHPTHVLGTIIGAGVGDINARGYAYEALGVIFSFDNDMSEMANQATNDALLLSNHSYGLRVDVNPPLPTYYFGGYIGLSQQIDDITFSAKYYQPVFAAGNDGDGNYNHLTARNTAKNAVVVAAISGVSTFNADGTPTSVNLAGFSNWGPTGDNRIKPDICNKGVSVYSSSNASDTAHANSQGTSMAAPGITGALLLLQQHYSNVNSDSFMRSATLRALMAHTADDANNIAGPDAKTGWGLIDAKAAAELITNEGETSLIEELVLLPGQTFTRNVLSLGAAPLIATLSWTDPAGFVDNADSDPSIPTLRNDLDIRVTRMTDNQVYFPWKLATSLSDAAVKGDNIVDNIEKTEVENAGGWYTITVSHKGSTLVNPATGASPSQEFSLIVSGIDATALANEQHISKIFSIWPNPASDNVTISLAGMENDYAVNVFDSQGRLVVNKILTSQDTVLDTSGLSTGIYMVSISDGERTEVKKLIIK